MQRLLCWLPMELRSSPKKMTQGLKNKLEMIFWALINPSRFRHSIEQMFQGMIEIVHNGMF